MSDHDPKQHSFTEWGEQPKAVGAASEKPLCATFHRAAGADPLAVKILLGHKGTDVTDDVYTHLDAAWLRAELSKFSL